ncbi:hypothetical protein J437_LFUL003237 [Ladona fulva]|uniref:TM7S3/TM198-like domain-containing protein n=1 Tax=Ladona fulva TaxID=123851 RepID=A0A8K0JSY8_LADFU|nr:hypothetical protein J437_LFUL003237 [Ladona fulva]
MITSGTYSFKVLSLISSYSILINVYVPLIILSSISSNHAASTFSSEVLEIRSDGNILCDTEEDEVIFENVTTLSPMSRIQVHVNETIIPPGTEFLVVQVHTQNFNLSISYNQTLISHFHVNGTNVGLVVPVLRGKTSDVFITNHNISRNISALIAVLAYGKNAPVPGGCNMVASVETAPYLEISYSRSVVRVDVQAPSPPEDSIETCSFMSVNVEMYHAYLPERDYSSETYFATIQEMLTVNRIRKHAHQVRETVEGPKMRRIFSAYPGTGSVYAVIATYEGMNDNYYSAYIPAVTYACSTMSWADSCEVLTSTFAKLLCAIIFFVGLFVCFLGQRLFQPQVFIHSFFLGGLISYIVFSGFLQIGLYVSTLTVAFTVAVTSMFFWRSVGWPLLHIMIVYLNLGFLMASVIFFAGLGDFYLMESDINYWSSFAILVLLFPMVTTCFSKKICIIAGAILGAFAVIVPIDHYIGSNLKFILLNTVRRATVPEFKYAVINPPYGDRDLALTATWIVLSLIGMGIQSALQYNRPPYPPPPSNFCCCQLRWPSHRQQLGERTPLLVDARIPSRTPPDGYDDVFEPSRSPSAPSSNLLFPRRA